MFAQRPLSFEYYANDIKNGFIANDSSLLQNTEENILAEELKLSCTNVMLQCFDAQSRCIYVLGVMFRLDSKTAGEILNLSAEAYRQRLSRIKKQMAEFLKQYCGLSGGSCNCEKRVGYAIKGHRLNPNNLEYLQLNQLDEDISSQFIRSMDNLDAMSAVFSSLPKYSATNKTKQVILQIINSKDMLTVCGG